jgi:transcriptional regulator with XRE-family HTH domain
MARNQAARRGQPAEPAVHDGVTLAAQLSAQCHLAEAVTVVPAPGDDAGCGRDELGILVGTGYVPQRTVISVRGRSRCGRPGNQAGDGLVCGVGGAVVEAGERRGHGQHLDLAQHGGGYGRIGEPGLGQRAVSPVLGPADAPRGQGARLDRLAVAGWPGTAGPGCVRLGGAAQGARLAAGLVGERAQPEFAHGRTRSGPQHRIAALITKTTGEDVSYTTIWKLRNGQAQNPQKRLIEALAKTFGVPPAFFFDDYDDQAGLLEEQVELLALVRDARISSAQLRAILELSPQARQAIISLVEATARDDARGRRSEADEQAASLGGEGARRAYRLSCSAVAVSRWRVR